MVLQVKPWLDPCARGACDDLDVESGIGATPAAARRRAIATARAVLRLCSGGGVDLKLAEQRRRFQRRRRRPERSGIDAAGHVDAVLRDGRARRGLHRGIVRQLVRQALGRWPRTRPRPVRFRGVVPSSEPLRDAVVAVRIVDLRRKLLNAGRDRTDRPRGCLAVDRARSTISTSSSKRPAREQVPDRPARRRKAARRQCDFVDRLQPVDASPGRQRRRATCRPKRPRPRTTHSGTLRSLRASCARKAARTGWSARAPTRSGRDRAPARRRPRRPGSTTAPSILGHRLCRPRASARVEYGPSRMSQRDGHASEPGARTPPDRSVVLDLQLDAVAGQLLPDPSARAPPAARTARSGPSTTSTHPAASASPHRHLVPELMLVRRGDRLLHLDRHPRPSRTRSAAPGPLARPSASCELLDLRRRRHPTLQIVYRPPQPPPDRPSGPRSARTPRPRCSPAPPARSRPPSRRG